MANLTGSPLNTYVQKQIEIRQKVLGNNPEVSDIDKRVLTNHNKGAWVRLASSVNVTTDHAIEELSSQIIPKGELLAQQLVLIGGITSTFGGADFPKGGVVPNRQVTQDIFQSSQYSYGLGNLDYGLTPMPALDTVSIQHLNRGAIRKFQIRLTVQNKDQLTLIELLYLRLGYYMLLEWGHTSYIDNTKSYISQPEFLTTAFQNFFDDTKKDVDIEDAILDGRYSSGGNYDGALFKVDNFSWSVNTDGSYNITLSGISKGGLIDSLTIGSPKEFGKDENKPAFTDYFIINPDKNKKQEILKKLGISGIEDSDVVKIYKDTIGKRLSKGDFSKLKEIGAIKLKNSDSLTNPDVLNISSTFDSTDDDAVITILDQNKSVINNELFKIFREIKAVKNWTKVNEKFRYKKVKLRDELLKSEGIQDLGEALAIKFDNASKADNAAEYNYITLGALLSIIKEKVLTSNNNITVPISDGYKDNYMFTHWFQHSTNPEVCLIPFDTGNQLNTEGLNVDTTEFNKILSTTFRKVDGDTTPSSDYKGYLMAVHINIEFISKTLNASASEGGGINLYNFLEKLMYGIQQALGNINRFTVTYSETTGIVIKDDTIIPNINDQETDDTVKLKLYGTNPGVDGSFLRNISAQSKITSKMATQIAIGSTASGNSINNSTSLLSRWNSGLIDRIQAAEPNIKNTTDADSNELLDEVNKQYKTQLKFLKDSYENFKYLGRPNYTTAQTTLKNLLEYDLAVKTINGNIAGKGFIPLDLSLEMDGLSGILLYQKLQTTNEILPASYSGKVDFIVQALDHSIAGNEWTTTVNTLSVPKKTDLTRKLDNKDNNEFSLLNPINSEIGNT
tara:strand:+ start:14503 stop:17043 length:2541 start_codon:yes stop_codon:yes gene_type:complete